MDATVFVERLRSLTGSEIVAVAEAVRHEHETVDGEISWWRATIALGADLRRHHRSREAGLAAHEASTAVLDAARDAADVRRDDVIVVARAAAEVARVVVADHDHDLAPATTAVLWSPWQRVALVPA